MGGQGAKKERVGLLGGSFSPPHRAHVELARLALKEKKVDRVWVLPCFEHPFGKPLEPFPHRLAMCRLAFVPLGADVDVLETEKKLGGKSYTLRMVRHLQEAYPGKTFFWIAGADAHAESVGWEQAGELKKAIGWIVYPRGPGSPIPDVSATVIRQALRTGKGLEAMLPKNVIEYIVRHHLYKD